VCCAGAKETAHRPIVFLSPLLHLAGQKIGVCLHMFALSAITCAHILESAGITLKRGHWRLCIFLMLVQGPELLVKSHTSVPHVFSTSAGSVLPTWLSLLHGLLSAPLLPWPGEGTACGQHQLVWERNTVAAALSMGFVTLRVPHATTRLVSSITRWGHASWDGHGPSFP